MSERKLRTVGMKMYEDMHRTLKARAVQEDTHMYEIIDAALKAYGVIPTEAGEQDNEKDSRS